MKPTPISGINRRALLSTLVVLPALSAPFFSVSAPAQITASGNMLLSWNDGPTKQAIKDARWKRPYTDLTYQPMQEVVSNLRANGYKTYIVTGGGQDFACLHRGLMNDTRGTTPVEKPRNERPTFSRRVLAPIKRASIGEGSRSLC
jgi:hypothetical protein